MESLISLFLFLQKSLSAVGPFFLLLGVLIFIHELGHFLAARYFGVQVEVFSLGFGPKILKYKKGDTVYCLSLLPLGGYVKMFGDNPLIEVPDSEKPKGFLYKRVPEKWIIAFAGPLMNFIFTLLAFFLIAIYGEPSIKPQLGDIHPDTPAYLAGFRSGDAILSVNNQAISYYEELEKAITTNVGKKLSFKVKSQSNEMKELQAVPHLIKNPNPLEWKKSIGSIEGLSLTSIGLRIGVRHDSPAYQAGLRTFDEILKINDQDLKYWRKLETFIKNTKAQNLSISIQRETETKNLLFNLPAGGRKITSDPLALLGIEPAYLYIERIGPDTPASQAGLMKGDRLISIDGKLIHSWEQVLNTIQSYSGQVFSIKYQRQNEQKTVLLSPKPLFVEGNIKKRFMLGIGSAGINVFPEKIIRNRSLVHSLAYSGQETWKWLGFITTGLIRLIQGEISLRTMGGPVAIGRVAHNSFHQGLVSFLFIMALISLNLGFLNLLPIPMLDGGHLLFFTLEGILGRPLPIKKLVVAQQMGMMFLLSFFALVFYNDIYNWLKAW